MLTIKQIIKMYEEGVEMHFSRAHVPPDFKGEYDPARQRIIIYTRSIVSPIDRDLTILHEHIHARDDVKSFRAHSSSDEEQAVEREAKETYLRRNYLLDFIRSFNRP